MPLFFVLVAGFIVFIVVAISRQKRRTREDAANLATALGFELVEGVEAVRQSAPPALEQAVMEKYEKLPDFMRSLVERAAPFVVVGHVDGVRSTIHVETRGSGKSRTTVTVARADYPKPLPIELRIGHEGTLTRLGKALFGLQDVEVGDEEFDRAVRIKAADEAAAKVIVGRSAEARDAILGLLAVSKSAFATQSCAQWEGQGIRLDVSEMRSVIGALVRVARSLGNADLNDAARSR